MVPPEHHREIPQVMVIMMMMMTTGRDSDIDDSYPGYNRDA